MPPTHPPLLAVKRRDALHVLLSELLREGRSRQVLSEALRLAGLGDHTDPSAKVPGESNLRRGGTQAAGDAPDDGVIQHGVVRAGAQRHVRARAKR